MKKFFFVYAYMAVTLIALGKFASVDSIPRSPASAQTSISTEKFKKSDGKILGLIHHTESAVKWRNNAVKAFHELMEYADANDGKFAANDLLKMHKGSTVYVRQIRRPILEIIREGEFLMDFKHEFLLQTQRATYIEAKTKRVRVAGHKKTGKRYKTIHYTEYGVNPLDVEGQLIMRELKKGLSASLALLDNFSIAMAPYFEDKKLRRSILQDIPAAFKSTSKSMKKIWSDYVKKYSHSKKLYKAIEIFQEEKEILKDLDIYPGKTVYLEALNKMIEDSLFYQTIEDGSNKRAGFFKRIAKAIRMGHQKRKDFYSKTSAGSMNSLSKVFGNTAGLFQSRHGKLFYMSEEEHDSIVRDMQPLDIVMEKTPFRLTDRFIPGHYGHAAIWTGNEEQLKELGVWSELPALYASAKKHYDYKGASFQEAVKSGHRIIEALRPGVQLNTLRHFLEIDDLTVLRSKRCNDENNSVNGEPTCFTNSQMKTYLIESFKQIGKDYDFNFDVNTEKKIVCSELAYRTYIDTDFNTDKAVGRHTISPDHVADKADEPNEPFYPVLIYFNGKKVSGDEEHLLDVMKLLLATDYPGVEQATGICQFYKEKKCKEATN